MGQKLYKGFQNFSKRAMIFLAEQGKGAGYALRN